MRTLRRISSTIFYSISGMLFCAAMASAFLNMDDLASSSKDKAFVIFITLLIALIPLGVGSVLRGCMHVVRDSGIIITSSSTLTLLTAIQLAYYDAFVFTKKANLFPEFHVASLKMNALLPGFGVTLGLLVIGLLLLRFSSK
jgi:hypothetical protein